MMAGYQQKAYSCVEWQRGAVNLWSRETASWHPGGGESAKERTRGALTRESALEE